LDTPLRHRRRCPELREQVALDRIGRFVGHGDVARSGFLSGDPSRINLQKLAGGRRGLVKKSASFQTVSHGRITRVPLPYATTENDLPGPLQHGHYVDFISLVSQLKVN
jgi:hypothetical protein